MIHDLIFAALSSIVTFDNELTEQSQKLKIDFCMLSHLRSSLHFLLNNFFFCLHFCSMHCVLMKQCIPAVCGARHWTSWTRWWSAAFCQSSWWETGSSSPTWAPAVWRSSAVSPPAASCLSITPSPPQTGKTGEK